MGGRTVISPTARGWRIRRRWRGPFRPATTPLHALVHRRWLVEATCLAIPSERWVWQVTGWHESARVVDQVAVALSRGDPSPQPGNAELVEHLTVAPKPVFPVGHVGPVRWAAARRDGNNSPDTPSYLHTAEVADILQVSPGTVARWAREGKLPFLKTPSGHRRYPAAQIRQLANELRVRPTSQRGPVAPD
jgi:excisionase family DNA binding protein